MLGLDQLTESGAIKLEGASVRNPWLQAVAVGLSIKAILHIRLFTVTAGAQSFPVGIESVVQIFEPWLLEGIDFDEFVAVRKFVLPRATKYPDLDDVRKRILANLPNHIKSRKEAVKVDLDKYGTVVEVMEVYLRLCDRRTFDLAFPDQKI